VDSVLADYRAQSAASREILAAGDLDARCALSHLVDENLAGWRCTRSQETARHAGHANTLAAHHHVDQDGQRRRDRPGGPAIQLIRAILK
jgi:hypothetical protein